MNHIGVSEAEIDMVVKHFYARVRKHKELGPVFNGAIGTCPDEWREHEAKIASFWRNALGIDRSYSGNPMHVHAKNPAVLREHFPTWLALFHESLLECLPANTAMEFSALAHRIGRGLSMGLSSLRGDEQGPPSLFG